MNSEMEHQEMEGWREIIEEALHEKFSGRDKTIVQAALAGAFTPIQDRFPAKHEALNAFFETLQKHPRGRMITSKLERHPEVSRIVTLATVYERENYEFRKLTGAVPEDGVESIMISGVPDPAQTVSEELPESNDELNRKSQYIIRELAEAILNLDTEAADHLLDTLDRWELEDVRMVSDLLSRHSRRRLGLPE